jgi:hypothetical protein
MEYIVSLSFFILNYNYIFMKFYDFVFFISVYVSKVHLTFLKDMHALYLILKSYVCIIGAHYAPTLTQQFFSNRLTSLCIILFYRGHGV